MADDQNPYVGPRSFRKGETLYGRDHEAAELQDLLIAERIVLVYSPSGAGKTSLLQAKLIPAMEDAGFHSRPILRPGLETNTKTGNRFLQACLDSLGATPGQTVAAALEGQPDSELLVFDQFEEVLTIEPGNREAKAEFFRQVGECLRNRGRWALFAMREDYLGGLDPFLRLMPTRFAARYRLDLLDREKAIEAIRAPAQAKNVNFAKAAAESLADDLRRDSPYVEPVQLQVVCMRLWQKLSALPTGMPREIGPNDVGGVADVNSALAGFYADCVKEVASAQDPERSIRTWFERRLITRQGIRGQVLAGPEQDLHDRTIGALIGKHLVRSDKRGAATWYELAHDRLIPPVLENNRQWREQNLSVLQRQADLWDEQKRQDGLLLRGSALAQADAWARKNRGLTPVEEEFLAACHRERRRRKVGQAAMAAVLVLALAAITALVFARIEWKRALRNAEIADAKAKEAKASFDFAQQKETEARKNADDADKAAQRAQSSEKEAQLSKDEALSQSRTATAGRLAAYAVLHQDSDPDVSSLLAIEAYRIAPSFEARNALLVSSQTNPRLLRYLRSPPTIRSILFANGGKTLVTGGTALGVLLWNPDTGELIRQVGRRRPIRALALAQDGHTLAVAGDTDVTILDLAGANPSDRPLASDLKRVICVAISADGKRVAAGASREIRVWDASSGQQIALWQNAANVLSLAFGPDGSMAAGFSNQRVQRFNPSIGPDKTHFLASGAPAHAIAYNAQTQQLAFGGQGVIRFDAPVSAASRLDVAKSATVRALAFFDNGSGSDTALASGGTDNAVTLWDLKSGSVVETLPAGSQTIVSIAISPERKLLATSSGAIFNLRDQPEESKPFHHLLNAALTGTSIAFSPDGILLASAGPDSAPQIWDVATGKLRCSLPDAGYRAVAIAFSPKGKLLTTVSEDEKDHSIKRWDPLQCKAAGASLLGHTALVTDLQFSPDGALLASGSRDRTVRFWDLQRGRQTGQAIAMEKDVGNIAFSADGAILAVASLEGNLRLFQMPGAKEIQGPVDENMNSYNSISAMTFSKRGGLMAVIRDDASVELLEVGRDIVPRRTLERRPGDLYDVAFHPDGTALATGGQNGTVQLWDTTSGLPYGPALFQTSDQVQKLAFSPDGKKLAVGGPGLWLLDVDPEVWARYGCSRANRNLTREEWGQYVGANVKYRQTCPNFPPAPERSEVP
ncbi:MAG TPA: WD40 repeat domain-containing protein [Bryobacteraceae bacterium]|nr:WD40 repeat domain-containing protein [Bryobacteraceae bacterium]